MVDMPLRPDTDKTVLLPPGFVARQAEAPWRMALAQALEDPLPGSLFYSIESGLLEAALILTPDRPVDNETGLRLATLAVRETIVAIVPPETTVAAPLADAVAVNHGRVATTAIACGPALADAIPAWLVLGFTLRLDMKLEAPGATPWLSDLAEEGIDVSGPTLLESLCRHLLSGIDIWLSDGTVGVSRAWDAAAGAAQPA